MRAKKRTTVVHSHQMRVRVSKKNPSGLTIRDQHIRRLSGTDVIKALIASESNFKENPTPRKIAIGITQITKSTLKVIQDPNGESKDFIFNKITQKDLKDQTLQFH